MTSPLKSHQPSFVTAILPAVAVRSIILAARLAATPYLPSFRLHLPPCPTNIPLLQDHPRTFSPKSIQSELQTAQLTLRTLLLRLHVVIINSFNNDILPNLAEVSILLQREAISSEECWIFYVTPKSRN